MPDRKHLPGKFVWFELASADPKKAQAFYRGVLGWKAVDFPVGNTTYEMIFAGETPDTMVGSYAPTRGDSARARWIASVSVDDVDQAVAAAVKNGGKVLAPPHDLRGVGRAAAIADPEGAELALLRNATGDPPDLPSVPHGRFVWSELHTIDAERAAAFYSAVVGYDHRAVPSPGGPYHILSRGSVDRGGITSVLERGALPYWLPYVRVDDVDAVIERARTLGARIRREPENALDVGRLCTLEDPTGAAIALLTPRPRANL